MKLQRLFQVTFVVGVLLLSVAVAPTQAQVHRDLEPGSLLVFPLFDATTGHVTEIRVTDTNDGPFGAGSVRLHYNIVCEGAEANACSARNFTRLITYHGTAVIRIPTDTPIPSGCTAQQGFVVVYATGTGAAAAPGGRGGPEPTGLVQLPDWERACHQGDAGRDRGRPSGHCLSVARRDGDHPGRAEQYPALWH